MSNTPRQLTRNQLAEFLPNARAVRALEQMLKQVGEILPEDIISLITETSTASTRAAQALDILANIQQSLELLASAPIDELDKSTDDTSFPQHTLVLSDLADTSINLPVAGMLLIYSATLNQWRSAAVTAGTNVTVTNADSSISISVGESGFTVVSGVLSTPGGATLITTNGALIDGAGVGIGTLTNAPAAGNPTKWVGIDDNGTTRYIPTW